MSPERSKWESVKELMGKGRQVVIGRHLAYQFMKTPRRILYYLSYYKFAAKMIGPGKRVLDIGCGEGLGTWLLAAECGFAKGIDIDAGAIKIAVDNWAGPAAAFECADFLELEAGAWDAVVSFDVIEHILPENAGNFFRKAVSCLSHDGVLVFGTPNITSDQYANPVTKAGHVNLYSGERLEEEMSRHFRHVFMFGANDEVVHTGFLPLAHYLIAMGCGKRDGGKR